MSMFGWRQGRPALVLAFLAVCVGLSAAAEKAEVRIKAAEDRLKHDLFYLADDKLEGRGPATEGLAKAADYIAAEFKKAGLQPAGQSGTYFQYFTVPGTRLMQPATLSLKGPKDTTLELKQGSDFYPLGLSKSGALKDAGLVFAGYGISTKEYDDYKGVEVANKVLIILREVPKGFKGPERAASLVEKINVADKAGALAILFVNNSAIATDGDDLINFGFHATFRGAKPKIPVFHVKRAVIDKLLADTTLTKLETAINESLVPQSKPLDGSAASLDLKVKEDGIELKNVVGVLEGKGPKAKETILLGAHYDHLGYGGFGSLGGLKKMAIHNGADDNGSGTVSILELARRFGAMKDRQGRRMVFITFAGEEMGLLGSRHYCKAPIFPLEETAAMINLDMVGRLSKDKERLTVLGVGSSKGFSNLLDDLNKKHGLTLAKQAGSRGDSDHHYFNQNKVPYLFFFSGMHPDYHRPTDDPDKINYVGMRRIVDLVEDVALHLATADDRPLYVKVEAPSGGGPRPGLPMIRLGIQPGYADEGDGLLVEAVSPKGIAERGGIKGGDRIVKMGDKPIKRIEEYMDFMVKQKKGDTIDVVVVREKKEVKLKLKLE